MLYFCNFEWPSETRKHETVISTAGALNMVKRRVANNDVCGKWQDLLALSLPMSRDSDISSKWSKKMGVWSEMGSNSQIRQNLDEIESQWCVINDSINGGVNGLMGGVLSPCLIGRLAYPNHLRTSKPAASPRFLRPPFVIPQPLWLSFGHLGQPAFQYHPSPPSKHLNRSNILA